MSLDEAERATARVGFTVEGDCEEVETFDHRNKMLMAGEGDGCPRCAIGCEAAGDDRPVAGAMLARSEALEGSLIGPEHPRVQHVLVAAVRVPRPTIIRLL